MQLMQVTGSAIDAVSLDQIRAFTRIDNDSEDDLLRDLVAAATRTLESAVSLVFIAQQWRATFDRWPKNKILKLPNNPLLSLDEVSFGADPNDRQVIALDNFVRYEQNHRAWLQPVDNGLSALLHLPVNVTFTCGFGEASDEVPAELRQAIMKLAAHGYEQRVPDPAANAQPGLPPDIQALIAPYRGVRL